MSQAIHRQVPPLCSDQPCRGTRHAGGQMGKLNPHLDSESGTQALGGEMPGLGAGPE